MNIENAWKKLLVSYERKVYGIGTIVITAS